MRGHNDDFLYDSTQNALLEFFSKAGSLFEKRGTYYGNESKALDLFKPAFVTDNVRAMKLAFWLRDCRGGAGNRSGFRSVVSWMSEKNPDWIVANINLVPETGRWDDLIACLGTPAEEAAVAIWAQAISEKDGLACKWVPRIKSKSDIKSKTMFSKLRKALDMSPKDFRKFVSENTNVIETIMCSNEWQDINYNTVPSVAMARSHKAFLKHDAARFDAWRESLSDPESKNKVNASVLFPHDALRTSYSDDKLANAQFSALPNYMEESNLRIMPIVDFSGSMDCSASGSITAMDVAHSLALYCSDKIGKDNPFYRMYIPFSNTSKLVNWKKKSFSEAANRQSCNGFYGSTNIKSGLDRILESAKMFNISNEQIPNCLLILSDMQFDRGTSNGNETVVESCMKEWEDAGYDRPNIIYWNLAGYAGSPATKQHENVALVSGFSPSILGSILGGADFSPMAVLDQAISKYEVQVPSRELTEDIIAGL